MTPKSFQLGIASEVNPKVNLAVIIWALFFTLGVTLKAVSSLDDFDVIG